MVTDLIIDRHPTGIVSVSGLVRNARDTWLCTCRIVGDGEPVTDADAARRWREHVAMIGARPV